MNKQLYREDNQHDRDLMRKALKNFSKVGRTATLKQAISQSYKDSEEQ